MRGLWRQLRARLRAWLHRDAVAGEIREELEFHLRMRTDEYQRSGDTPPDAALRARRRFGNVAVVQDRGYDVRGGGVMETIVQDARYAVRLMWRQRGFSALALMTLALGIGLSTALFSLVDAALLHPLPYPHPEQLVSVSIETSNGKGAHLRLGPSLDDVRQMREGSHVFTALGVWRSILPPPVVVAAEPERVSCREIDEGYLDVYGVTPIAGRGIQAADIQPGAAPVVLLGYDYWHRRYGGNRDVVGQTIRFDDRVAAIVGVLPASFNHDTAIWRPLAAGANEGNLNRRGSGTSSYGRLRDGLTLDQARRELSDLVARLPASRAGDGAAVQSLLARATTNYSATLEVLTSAVGLILLIACVNVAGLLMAKGATRLPELAIRASMGAGRGRLFRQLLTESLVLSIAGGGLGVALAWWTLDSLVANVPLTLSANAPATLNYRVLIGSIALTAIVGVAFGLAPALRLSSARLLGPLAAAGRRSGSSLSKRGGQCLIAVEVALALVLLAGAGLMLHSFSRLLDVDLGFQPDAIVTLEASPIDQSAAAAMSYYPPLLDAIRHLPGVSAVGAIDHLPLEGSSTITFTKTAAGGTANINVRNVLPGYFEAIGLKVQRGRPPTDADWTTGHNAVVINEAARKMLFGDDQGLGRTFDLGGSLTPPEVVGVVGDVRFWGPMEPSEPEAYQLFHPVGKRAGALITVIRPSGDGRGLPTELRRVAAAVGPRVLVERVRNGGEWLDSYVATPKQRTVLLGLFGALGLLLTLVGVFGMTAYAVARRTQEIGVRMAFGARPRDVVRTMILDAVWPMLAGICIGVEGARLSTGVIATFLFETPPTEPVTLGSVAILLALAGAVAAWVPARRAARVDPVTALRSE